MIIKEITDKNIWEDFIISHAPQSLFQSWNWGETIRNIKNQKLNIKNKIWRIGFFDCSQLIGIAQIIKVSAKKGDFLHVRHGPILKVWKKEYLSFFFQNIKYLAMQEKAVFIRCSPLIDNSLKHQGLLKEFHFQPAPIHQLDGEYCWVLDLDKSENVLLAGMRKTTRYLINKAMREGVEIKKSTSEADLEDFLKLYYMTARRQGFVPHKGIREEFEEFKKDNQIFLLLGYYQKKLLSAALILFYNYQAIYHHSASIEQKIPVNYLLQWEVIREAIKRKKKVYNFWGIAPNDKPRHPWAGLSLFKKGFGGRVVEYLHAQDLPLSPLYFVTYMTESVRKIKKGY